MAVHNRLFRGEFWTTQLCVAVLLAASWVVTSWGAVGVGTSPPPVPFATARFAHEPVPVPRREPLRVSPLYDDAAVVSLDHLGAVLRQVAPRFPREKLKPNFVEHALRIWSVDATFLEPGVMSGVDLRDVLTDHGRFLASWGRDMSPLLQEDRGGVAVRWGREECASVHHDHWLASLTEAGAPLDQPIFMPSKQIRTLGDALQTAILDFKLDEREVEWSAMAFGLWIAPAKQWTNRDGRRISFDMLATRLMRGDKQFGVCEGLHRVYSLMLLVRIDDDHPILSPGRRDEVMAHLRRVRDLIIESQFSDGHWPSNWSEGRSAVENPVNDPLYKQVIATGHHLEWLSIAPPELHPPREAVVRAANWAVRTTLSRTQAQILDHYTFYSHVGGALANWRKQRPSDFYRTWEPDNPAPPPTPTPVPAPTPASKAELQVPAETPDPEEHP